MDSPPPRSDSASSADGLESFAARGAVRQAVKTISCSRRSVSILEVSASTGMLIALAPLGIVVRDPTLLGLALELGAEARGKSSRQRPMPFDGRSC